MRCRLFHVFVLLIHFVLSYTKPNDIYDRDLYIQTRFLGPNDLKSTTVVRVTTHDSFGNAAFRHAYPTSSFGENRADDSLVQRLARRSDTPSWTGSPKINRMEQFKSMPYKRPEISLPPYHRLSRSKSETDELLRTSFSEGSDSGRSKSSSSKQSSTASEIAMHVKESQSLGSQKTPNENPGKTGRSLTRDALSEYIHKFPEICYTAGEAMIMGSPYVPSAAKDYII